MSRSSEPNNRSPGRRRRRRHSGLPRADGEGYCSVNSEHASPADRCARRLPRRHRGRGRALRQGGRPLPVGLPARPGRPDPHRRPGHAHPHPAARVPRPHPDVAAAGRGGGALVRDGLLRAAVLHPAHGVRPALLPQLRAAADRPLRALRVGHRAHLVGVAGRHPRADGHPPAAAPAHPGAPQPRSTGRRSGRPTTSSSPSSASSCAS